MGFLTEKIILICCVLLVNLDYMLFEDPGFIFADEVCADNDGCIKQLACIEGICLNPCPGPCYGNTICEVLEHVPSCSCKPGFSGNPHTGCEEKVPVNQCNNNTPCDNLLACIDGKCQDPCPGPCQGNTTCEVRDHVPHCVCKPGFSGNPVTGCQGQGVAVADEACADNHGCIKELACIAGKCQNPCPGPCYGNTFCVVLEHVPFCSCNPGFSGNPYTGCEEKVNQCNNNNYCDDLLACIDGKCQDPCPGPCHGNTICEVHDHVPYCVCKPGFSGNPFTGCQEQVPVNQCNNNNYCDTLLVCIDGKCQDPCPGPCHGNTICEVHDHVPYCACKPGFSGNPFTGCQEQVPVNQCNNNSPCDNLLACIDGKCQDPCPGPCQGNTTCEVRDHVPYCDCKPGFSGNPFTGCQGQGSVDQCNNNNNCDKLMACVNGKCKDPCSGLCSDNATCEVHDHVPYCTCMPGFSGNPIIGCKDKARYSHRCLITGSRPPGKKVYKVERFIKVNFYAAFSHCITHGGRLATVGTKDENALIKEEIRKTGIRNYEFWTSGTNLGGDWLWMSSGEVLPEFSDWNILEPNNLGGNEHCLEFYEKNNNGYMWNDKSCDQEVYPICEYFE
ncbi:protein crumbs homolog 1-like isoform X1 [Homalodisca vitripennis]|uniref:protein crumbs homolog 1-like isoform X1 n=1 Tax=Homalodisca vitripennis TaxID=197043 RepID=UPI001EEADFF3|nr:protein crumbs homolog 1-like isoform X1 [Homalodisca vitripennis]XP_046660568.1 protein crumbs homolog 1-like isoform X1 [Homalodisca vitripennis]